MNKDIKNLNKLLKGAIIGTETYDRYIKNSDDLEVISKFQQYKREYEEYSQELTDRIQELGGQPVKDTGMQGRMAKMTSTIRSLGGYNTDDLLKSAYKGEMMGIDTANRILTKGIDEKSRVLISNRINMASKNASEIVKMAVNEE